MPIMPDGRLVEEVPEITRKYQRRITSAELLALHDGTDSVPLVLLPAPGAGHALFVDEMVTRLIPAGTSPAAYTTGVNVQLQYAAPTPLAIMQVGSTAILTAGAAVRRTRQAANGANFHINIAVQLAVAAQIQNGNGDLMLTLYYRIVEI